MFFIAGLAVVIGHEVQWHPSSTPDGSHQESFGYSCSDEHRWHSDVHEGGLCDDTYHMRHLPNIARHEHGSGASVPIQVSTHLGDDLSVDGCWSFDEAALGGKMAGL